MKETENPLRCVCSGEPIIAVYGRDKWGKVYLRIKRWKQNRVLCEVVVTEGTVRVHCVRCLRWHKVVIRGADRPDFRLEELPESLSLPR